MRDLLFPLFVCASLAGTAAILPAPFGATFEYNAGQADPTVKFLSHGSGGSINLTSTGVRLTSPRGLVSLEFARANPSAEITGLDRQKLQTNYFLGADSSRWKTGVPNYKSVRYHGIYPGVDVLFYRNHSDNRSELEFDLIVEPGADPGVIRLALGGEGTIRLDGSGNLRFGGMVLRRPAIYQEGQGGRRYINGQFRRLGAREIGIRIARYDRARSLVVDPVLAYSSLLGGGSPSDSTAVYGIASDAAGNAYVTGLTSATDYPVTNALQANFGGPNGDAFVTKISADGSTLLYSTFLGGNNTDQGNAIAVDSTGAVWVTGVTESTNFPAVNPLQASHHSAAMSGGTGFVAKLSADGSRLLFSSYLGGSGAENPSGVAVDSTGAAYLTGVTYSSDFPILNAFEPTPGSDLGHGFVTKIQPDGSGLIYSTYLGGSAADQGMGIAADASGSAYVTGYTQSPDFPIKNAFQSALPGISNIYSGYPPTAFVTKFSSGGQTLEYSTFLGGQTQDGGVAIAVDNTGSAYVLGRTASSDFPLKNAFQSSSNGGTHAFVTKLNPTGSSLAYSTYLGGTNGSELSWSNGDLVYNAPGGIAVDLAGHAYVTGATYSTDFPVTSDAFQAALSSGFLNAFFSELTPDGSGLVYSTFMGGPSPASAYAIALDSAGNAYLGGHGGPGFPTLKPFPSGLSGGAFVSKFAAGAPPANSPQVSGVTNVDGSTTVAPASWIIIHGTNLCTVTEDWSGQIDSAGHLPTQLGGTTVSVDGKPAFLYYVSPTQINAIAPDDTVAGPIPMVVTANDVASTPVNVQWNVLSPALFLWPQNYVVATHTDFSLAVKNGAFPGTTTVNAHPGETIILWGAGLGPVTPPAPAGILTQTTGFVETPVTIHFGLFSQVAIAAALAQGEAAVYQIAVAVPPNLPAGDVAIAIEIGGAIFSTGLLTVGP
jgi:uncharacterized protein (TIGR03437 family)